MLLTFILALCALSLMGLQAIFRLPNSPQDYTPAVARTNGDIIQLADQRAAIVQTDLAISQKGAVFTHGQFDITSATGTLFAAGEEVWWDTTNKLAVKVSTITNSVPGYRLGLCLVAKVSGDLTVRTDLNAMPMGQRLKVMTSNNDGAADFGTSSAETVIATYSFAAGQLKTGSVIEFLAALLAVATNSTDTFQWRVRLGGLTGTVVADSTAIDLANNDVGVLSGAIVVTDDGATGHIRALSQSMLKSTANPLVVGSTAIDTTAAQTLVITATHSSANAGNTSRAVEFLVKQAA